MDIKRLNYLALDLKKKDGVFVLTEELQNALVECSSIQEFPGLFERPVINDKLKFTGRKGTGRCVIASEIIRKGEIICHSNSSKIDRPLKYSWQIDDNIHLIGPGALDHSCSDPTCCIDPETNNLIALRDIQVGEVVTFNYLTTEYVMRVPFQCLCGQEGCFGLIKGFKYLSEEEKRLIDSKFPIARYLKKYIKTY